MRVEARWPMESCAECELVIYQAEQVGLYSPLERFATSLCRFGCGLHTLSSGTDNPRLQTLSVSFCPDLCQEYDFIIDVMYIF